MSLWFTLVVQVGVLIGATGLAMRFVHTVTDRWWVTAITATIWAAAMTAGWSGGFKWLHTVLS